MTNEVHLFLFLAIFLVINIMVFFGLRNLGEKGSKFEFTSEKMPGSFKEKLVYNLNRFNKTYRIFSKETSLENKFYSLAEANLILFFAIGFSALCALELRINSYINMAIFLALMRVFNFIFYLFEKKRGGMQNQKTSQHVGIIIFFAISLACQALTLVAIYDLRVKYFRRFGFGTIVFLFFEFIVWDYVVLPLVALAKK